ncbi:MAG: endolytic transglycosylase MltG [Bacteroidetes bacterium]|nr:endolytic transglycosylase MltG [Bacteroidota bacterium]
MRWLKPILLILLVLIALTSWYGWDLVYRENTAQSGNRSLKIPEGSGWEDVMSIFRKDSLLRDPESLNRLASWTDYQDRVKAGLYRIKPGMSNKDILRLLSSGRQEEVKIILRSSWNKPQLIAYLSEELTADSMQLVNLLNDSVALTKYGWNTETVIAAFIPNTYHFYWTTSAREVLDRMNREYDGFWNKERKRRAETEGLSPVEVSILASIVEKETSKADEMPTIAGVYLNRLRKGMKLEADPTVIYAVGNPAIRRVTHAMLEVQSPYNTYWVNGLPPGPICMPSIQAIEAVLKNEKHDYIYFCAKEDFSGYHNFTSSYNQHVLNARKYRLELSKRGIH